MKKQPTKKKLDRYFNNIAYLARQDEEETQLMIETTKKHIDSAVRKDAKP